MGRSVANYALNVRRLQPGRPLWPERAGQILQWQRLLPLAATLGRLRAAPRSSGYQLGRHDPPDAQWRPALRLEGSPPRLGQHLQQDRRGPRCCLGAVEGALLRRMDPRQRHRPQLPAWPSRGRGPGSHHRRQPAVGRRLQEAPARQLGLTRLLEPGNVDRHQHRLEPRLRQQRARAPGARRTPAGGPIPSSRSRQACGARSSPGPTTRRIRNGPMALYRQRTGGTTCTPVT